MGRVPQLHESKEKATEIKRKKLQKSKEKTTTEIMGKLLEVE